MAPRPVHRLGLALATGLGLAACLISIPDLPGPAGSGGATSSSSSTTTTGSGGSTATGASSGGATTSSSSSSTSSSSGMGTGGGPPSYCAAEDAGGGGLVLFFTFDGTDGGTMSTGKITDWSGNNNDGYLEIGSLSYVDGQTGCGQAVVFHGNGDLDAGGVVGGGSVTAAAWVQVDFSGYFRQTILSKSTDGQKMGLRLYVEYDAGAGDVTPKFWIGEGVSGVRIVASGYTHHVLAAHWVHVAGVYDSQNHVLQVYFNGAPEDGGTVVDDGGVTSLPTSMDWTNASLGTLPLIVAADPGTNKMFNVTGAIDDVRVYARALPASDVRQLVPAPPQ